MGQARPMADGTWYDADIDHVIISEEQIRDKTEELAKQVAADYADADGASCWSACSRARSCSWPTSPGRWAGTARRSSWSSWPSPRTARAPPPPGWCASSRTWTATSPAGT